MWSELFLQSATTFQFLWVCGHPTITSKKFLTKLLRKPYTLIISLLEPPHLPLIIFFFQKFTQLIVDGWHSVCMCVAHAKYKNQPLYHVEFFGPTASINILAHRYTFCHAANFKLLRYAGQEKKFLNNWNCQKYFLFLL